MSGKEEAGAASPVEPERHVLRLFVSGATRAWRG